MRERILTLFRRGLDTVDIVAALGANLDHVDKRRREAYVVKLLHRAIEAENEAAFAQSQQEGMSA
jgi:hypothetical protein